MPKEEKHHHNEDESASRIVVSCLEYVEKNAVRGGLWCQHFDNALCQMIINLSVARNRLRELGMRILIPVVLGSVPNEDTTHLF